jgi:UDP-N-acetylmuramoylalanine--D-glutamate ligase
MEFEGEKILILGLGLSGRAAAKYVIARGGKVCAVDNNQELLNENQEIEALRRRGVRCLHDTNLRVGDFQKLIVSPGIPQTHPLYQQALTFGVEILGEMELALRALENPCLAITGSNGKTTTTLLVEHVLNFVGIKARSAGNIGLPLTAIIDTLPKEEVIVLELSSWQLETLRTAAIDAAVVLNITPNHLDRHLTIENYAKAKLNLRHCLKSGKTLYMGEDCFDHFNYLIEKTAIKTFGYSSQSHIYCDRTNVYHEGKIQFGVPSIYQGKKSHDVENMMAAFALCMEIGVTGEQFASALPTFKKPPHRIEFVRNIGGVSYYNDSKGTSLDAVVKAVESMDGPSILIAGGVHKGAAYTPWLTAFDGKVRHICAIGQAAEKIRSDLGIKIAVDVFETLEEALVQASSLARNGENVLLSPGCSSYDMFKSYEHRGDEFKRLVETLATRGKKPH